MKKIKYLFYILIFCFLIWSPSIFNFFSGDDWFHLRISQIVGVKEFFNFFSFYANLQSASFYRPLPTQIFFFVFQTLFGLRAWPYYFFVLICFLFSIYLVFLFAMEYIKDENKSFIVALLYGTSSIHFAHLYFLSSFQEISLVIFSLLSLLSYKKSLVKSLLFFFLALLSKETAATIPLLILVFNFTDIRKNIKKFFPFVIITAGYLYLRLGVFGIASGDSYIWNFSLAKILNTLMWYVLWGFGAPELLVDYIGSGLIPVAKLFTEFPNIWPIIIFPLLVVILLSIFFLINKIKSIKSFLSYILLFLIPLAPVVFLPQHKFPLELGLSIIGFSLCIALLLPKSKIFSYSFIALLVGFNIAMIALTYFHHYSVSRGTISKKVFSYFTQNYPFSPAGKYFYFINDTKSENETWGQSKQISQALSGSDFFKVFYHDRNINVYYQDIPTEKPFEKFAITLNSSMFLTQ